MPVFADRSEAETRVPTEVRRTAGNEPTFNGNVFAESAARTRKQLAIVREQPKGVLLPAKRGDLPGERGNRKQDCLG